MSPSAIESLNVVSGNPLSSASLTHWIVWSLIHFLWQGTAVAAALWLALSLIPRNASQHRCLAACLAMLIFAMCPIVTGITLSASTGGAARISDNAQSASNRTTGDNLNVPVTAVTPSTSTETSENPLSGDSQVTAAVAAGWQDVRRFVERHTRKLTLLWLAGVLLLSLRLLLGLWNVENIRRSAVPVRAPELTTLFRRLCSQLNIQHGVRLLSSTVVDVPTVIGAFKPIVLLPMATIHGLTPQQLEALLAHELAHVARHDYLINVFQCWIEVLLFFHPAVWWVSSQIRQEREHCCDAVAVQQARNRSLYAQTLLELGRQANAVSPTVVAATGGHLLERVRRILGQAPGPATRIRSTACVPAITALLGMSILLTEPAHLRTDAAEQAAAAQRMHVNFIIAEHVILFERQRIVTWNEVEAILWEAAAKGPVRPCFYSTNGGRAHEEELREERWKLIRALQNAGKVNGLSVASLSPRAGERYDRIQRPEDLIPDASRRLQGMVLTTDRQPAPDVEVFLLPKEHINGVYLQDGRIRTPLDEHLARTDSDGRFEIYPEEGEELIAFTHPDGFAITSLNTFRKSGNRMQLRWWASVSGTRPVEGDDAEQGVHFTSHPVEGIAFRLYDTDIADDGSFRQPHIPPGAVVIHRVIDTGNGGTSGFQVEKVRLKPRESHAVELGPISESIRLQIERSKLILQIRR